MQKDTFYISLAMIEIFLRTLLYVKPLSGKVSGKKMGPVFQRHFLSNQMSDLIKTNGHLMKVVFSFNITISVYLSS